jgi:tetratricopeptide (TPR) repeat protein
VKKEDAGLFCLLAAVFFAVVAGGHVSMDALPESRAAGGILVTLLASCAIVWGLLDPKTKHVPTVIGALLVLYDPLDGGQMFTTVRVFIALLVFGGLAFVVGKDRVMQMPTVWYAGFLALLVAGLGTSIMVSEFRTVSVDAWVNWLVFAAGLYLAVATLGRKRGPHLLIETIVLAAGLVATKGIIEFLLARAGEPGYRIFADWNNPNALAGMLVTALPLALYVGATSEGAKRTVAWVAATFMATAIVLTQSQGGLLVAPIGIVAFVLTALAWRGGKRIFTVAVPLVAAVAVIGVIKLTTPQLQTQPTANPQTAAIGQNHEQASSARYRLLLWRGAVELIKRQPVGLGVGTYRFHSARSGLTEQTHLTHQSLLQVSVEGGFIAFIGILGLGIAWTIRVLTGAKALDEERNLMRAAVFAAVVACAANGFLESNLYYFGAGLLFFVLLGAGLQLSADGTSPESLPNGLRASLVVGCCVLPLVACVWAMYMENAKSRLLTALMHEGPSEVQSAAESLKAMAGQDGEAWYLLAWMFPTNPQERVALATKAVQLAPSTRHYRVLAESQFELGQHDAALQTIDKALERDPNNLRTLMLKLEFEDKSGALAAAVATAERIVAVEQTDYLKTRALAELIPTEPYEARIFLVKHEPDINKKIELLTQAIDGFLRYKAVTIPKVKLFDSGGLDFVGETRKRAEEKMAMAREAADQLALAYESAGEPEKAEEARKMKELMVY